MRLSRKAPQLCSHFPSWCATQRTKAISLQEGQWQERLLPVASNQIPTAFLPHAWYWQPPRILVELRGAKIVGSNGAIILPDGRFLVEVAWDPKYIRDDPVYAERRGQRAVRKRGTYFSCFLFWHEWYYHWIHDVAARLHGVLEKLPDETLFLVPPKLKRYQWRTLELAGVPRERCLVYEGEEPWEMEKFYHATPAAHCGHHNRSTVRWLHRVLTRGIVEPVAPNDRSRIYISRRKARCRRIVNEEELQPVLRAFNFQTVVAEDHSFEEQIRLFGGASHVLGSHGAGLSNIIFSPPGGTLIELFEPEVVRHCYWSLACAHDFRYACFVGETVPRQENEPDMRIDPGGLRKLLEQLLPGTGGTMGGTGSHGAGVAGKPE